MATPKIVPHDFLNPFMAASLVTASGQRVPFWTSTTDTGSGGIMSPAEMRSRYGIVSLPFVSETQIITNLGGYPRITVTLTPPYEDGIKFLDSDLIEWGRTLLEVQLGYVYGTTGLVVQSPVYRGVTLKPEIQIGTETVIKLNAQGVGAFSMLRHERGRIFNNKTREQVIKELVKLNQVGDSTGALNPGNQLFSINEEALKFATNAKKNPEQAKRLSEEKRSFSQGHRSDLQFLIDLCRESLCWPLFVGSELFIVPRGSLGEEPSFILSLFESTGVIGPATGVWPILGATSPNMEVYLPFSQFGLRDLNINSASPRDFSNKQPVVEDKTFSDKTGRQASLGGGSATSTSLSTETGAPVALKDTNNPRAKDEIQNEYEMSRVKMGVNLDLVTLGIPDLVPGTVINVRGLGTKLSGPKLGNYAVFEVTHTYSNSGYFTAMTCWSNSSPLGRSQDEEVSKLNDLEASAQDPNPKGTVRREPREEEGAIGIA